MAAGAGAEAVSAEQVKAAVARKLLAAAQQQHHQQQQQHATAAGGSSRPILPGATWQHPHQQQQPQQQQKQRQQAALLQAAKADAARAAAASTSGGLADPSMGCEFCRVAVQYVKVALASNESIAQIEASLDGLCNTMSFGGPDVIDCATVSSLPTLVFTIGGATFELGPQDYILRIDQGGAEQCVSGFMGLDVPAGALLLLRHVAPSASFVVASKRPHSPRFLPPSAAAITADEGGMVGRVLVPLHAVPTCH